MTTLLSSIEALAVPSSWLPVPAEPDDDTWADEAAALLTADAAVRAELARVLRLAAPHPYLVTAAWVPDPAQGVVCGLLTLDRLLPEPGERADRDDHRARVEAEAEADVLERQVDVLELPAGPTLRVREVVVPPPRDGPWGRTASRRVVYTVFSPDGVDALELTFTTDVAALVDDLEADAAAAVGTLRTVTVEAEDDA